ncbi:hypothetical protein G647_06612 [Cladophialophora carrionii CBS 160.54]|uniref:HAUS augmin-like complex subunit 6 N-terminal domain-containing protein n=1 Tax=Cladophialophora carrionii CBS 160.54 TaxID=1279043 RepID=V9D985_9EURO|nr:uncharacterized protein G647_06612 [Cladophialophora carrionii CBS 160.54]ETI22537.1 hypothetical protein G647_06612 [Cladophialophora carrionii CBS 160.54]
MERPPAPRLQWSPRSNIAIFIHALHLLDLDLLPSWPGISESLFASKSVQNHQARVKSTEWALYHLFRLYSPPDTQSRLAPHFPPTTSLQSKNLRAALYKWLAELKSTAVLPREVVLRKTMLDECKGDKFEEVLAKVAMVVLKKTLPSRNHERRTGERPGSCEQNFGTLVPLIMAHRVSLRQSLAARQDLEAKAMAYSERLAQLQQEILPELQNLQAASDGVDGAGQALPAREYESLRQQVDLAFATDRRWARYIFEGSAAEPGYSAVSAQKILPTWPFDDPGPTLDQGPAITTDDDDSPLNMATASSEGDANEPMRELQFLISQNHDRLEHLTRLQETLLSSTEPESHPEDVAPVLSNFAGVVDLHHHHPSATAQSISRAPKPRFNKHQALTLAL